MWTGIAAICGVLVIILPVFVTIYNRYFSKKAKNEKRQAEEIAEIGEQKKTIQEKTRDEGRAHDAQDAAIEAHLKKKK